MALHKVTKWGLWVEGARKTPRQCKRQKGWQSLLVCNWREHLTGSKKVSCYFIFLYKTN